MFNIYELIWECLSEDSSNTDSKKMLGNKNVRDHTLRQKKLKLRFATNTKKKHVRTKKIKLCAPKKTSEVVTCNKSEAMRHRKDITKSSVTVKTSVTISIQNSWNHVPRRYPKLCFATKKLESTHHNENTWNGGQG